MELMIDIVASALTFETWAVHESQSATTLCRTQSTSSNNSEPTNEHTRIYRQNMPHLQPPIVPPTMRLIEQIPNLCLYDA